QDLFIDRRPKRDRRPDEGFRIRRHLGVRTDGCGRILEGGQGRADEQHGQGHGESDGGFEPGQGQVTADAVSEVRGGGREIAGGFRRGQDGGGGASLRQGRGGKGGGENDTAAGQAFLQLLACLGQPTGDGS